MNEKKITKFGNERGKETAECKNKGGELTQEEQV